MDGLILIVALIAWIAFSLKKKNNKDQERIRQIQARTAQHMQERAEKMRAEMAMPTAPSIDERIKVSGPERAEGESVFLNVSSENEFRGSLQSDSLEGECVCSPELEHVRDTQIEKESVYANEIGKSGFVDVSARGIMQAIVMNEILTRPKQRSRRY